MRFFCECLFALRTAAAAAEPFTLISIFFMTKSNERVAHQNKRHSVTVVDQLPLRGDDGGVRPGQRLSPRDSRSHAPRTFHLSALRTMRGIAHTPQRDRIAFGIKCNFNPFYAYFHTHSHAPHSRDLSYASRRARMQPAFTHACTSSESRPQSPRRLAIKMLVRLCGCWVCAHAVAVACVRAY